MSIIKTVAFYKTQAKVSLIHTIISYDAKQQVVYRYAPMNEDETDWNTDEYDKKRLWIMIEKEEKEEEKDKKNDIDQMNMLVFGDRYELVSMMGCYACGGCEFYSIQLQLETDDKLLYITMFNSNPQTKEYQTNQYKQLPNLLPLLQLQLKHTLNQTWQTLNISLDELSCVNTLTNGQCFTWHKTNENEWKGVLDNTLFAFRDGDKSVEYQVCSSTSIPNVEKRLQDYFQIERLGSLKQHCEKEWKIQCSNLTKGARLVEMDPIECLFSFICSIQNNIPRIHSLVDKLRILYGTHIQDKYYSFPTLEQLTKATEEQLREKGFGYRAKYIVLTIKKLQSLGGAKWLYELRDDIKRDAAKELQQLDGVGPKVAACICLMSLRRYGSVPIDTHMKQWFFNTYPQLEIKKCTDIEQFLSKQYGPFAGWAQLLVFIEQRAKPRLKKRKTQKII